MDHFEYMVVTHKQPAALVKQINEAAADGWRVVCPIGDSSVILERTTS